MALSIDNLIQINSEGVQKADYADIVKSLIEEYKQIYGYDIDVDPRTADGRFIYDVATIINSGLNVITQLYNNLNPSVASGSFLDIICSLTNVSRQSATPSYAQVKFHNNSDSEDITILGDSGYLDMIDDSGNEWICDDDATSVIFPRSGDVTLRYRSRDVGKVYTSNLKFEVQGGKNYELTPKITSFTLGSEEESDTDLRYRRSSDSAYGYSVLNGLKGALKKTFKIKDVYIKSYSGSASESANVYVNNAVQTLPAHSVAILIRSDYYNKASKTVIANTIHNYLTPGVSTYGSISYEYITGTGENEKVSWFMINPVHPTIMIKITPFNNFGGQTTANAIASALVEYLNNLPISYNYSLADISNVIQGADPLSMSRPTYAFVSISGLGDFTSDKYVNKGTAFEYGSRKDIDYGVTYSNNNIIITKKE